MPAIVLWIPIDEDCNVVFEKVNQICNESDDVKRTNKWPNPQNYIKVHKTESIAVTKLEKNPYCYWVQQGGYMKEI